MLTEMWWAVCLTAFTAENMQYSAFRSSFPQHREFTAALQGYSPLAFHDPGQHLCMHHASTFHFQSLIEHYFRPASNLCLPQTGDSGQAG